MSSGEESVSSGKSFQHSTRISEEPQEEMLVMHGMPQPLDHHNCPFPLFSTWCTCQCIRFNFFPHCPAVLNICQEDVFLRLTPLIDRYGKLRQMPILQGQSSSPCTEGVCSLSDIIQQHLNNKMKKRKQNSLTNS